MIKNYFVMGIVAAGFVASWVGCSSSSGSGTGANTTTSSGTPSGSTATATTGTATTGSATTGSGGASTGTATTTSSTGGSTTGTGGTGGSEGTGGAPNAGFVCTVPATPPSKGSCVTFTAPDGGEADAGVDTQGNATSTTCDPVTNAGCTGTDTCGVDASGEHYFCQAAGTPGGVALCGDCSADTATCGPGLICVGINDTEFYCVAMCCSDGDCGSSGTCDMNGLTNPLPSGVGICDM